IIIDFDIFKTFISILYVDAETGNPVGENGPPHVETIIGGEHSEGILNLQGKIQKNINSISGLISLVINPFDPYIPNKQKPVNFTISGNSEGYLPNLSKINICDTGYHKIIIPILPDGTSINNHHKFKINLGETKNGGLNNDHSLSILSNKFSIGFPDSLPLLDYSENALSGNIEIISEWYRQINYIPGFNSGVQTIQIEGETEEVEFIPDCIVNIDLLVNDQDKANSFDGETINWNFPVSCSDFQSDSIPIWYFNFDSNIWIFDQFATITKNNSECYATAQLSHLSLYCAGQYTQTRLIHGSVKFSYEKPFIESIFDGQISVYKKSDNTLLHNIPITFTENNIITLDFSIPQNSDCLIRYKPVNSDFAFSANPESIEIKKTQNNFDAEISLKPLKCLFNAKINLELLNVFPEMPVPAIVKIINNQTGEILKQFNHNIYETTNELTINTMLQEGVPIKIKLLPGSLANTFNTYPDEIIIDESCQNDFQLDFALTSTSCVAEGQFTFLEPEGFINYPVPIRIRYLRLSDKQIIHEKVHNVQREGGVFSFSLTMPMETAVTIELQSFDPEIACLILPENITWESPCTQYLESEINIQPDFNILSGNIHFEFIDDLNYEEIPVGIVFKKKNNDEIVHQANYIIPKSDPNINFNIPVQNDPLYIIFTRNDQNKKFIPKPYRIDLPSYNETPGQWTVELHPVEMVFVNFLFKVVCPSLEIYPTGQAYYRIPGESWIGLNIIDGRFTIEVEFGATYEVGMILDGEMTASAFIFDKTDYDLIFDLGEDDCEKMGWGIQ
ncbi:hypothetical protein ACFLRG_03465, partial [Bacteroidota bacterium]